MMTSVTTSAGRPSWDAMFENGYLLLALSLNNLPAIQAFISQHGGGKIVAYDWDPQTLPPSWLVIDWGGNFFSVTLSGSQNPKQIAGNGIAAVFADYPGNKPYTNAFCYSTWTAQVKPKIWDLLPKGKAGSMVIFAGHSFGGQMAVLASSEYAANFGRYTCQCMTFAAPKTFTSAAEIITPLQTCEVALTYDAVPHLPPTKLSLAVPRTFHLLHISEKVDWIHVYPIFELTDQAALIARPADDYDGNEFLIAINAAALELTHMIDPYAIRILAGWNREVGHGTNQPLAARFSAMTLQAPAQTVNTSITPSNSINVPAVNDVYFPGVVPAPVGPSNVNTLLFVSITLSDMGPPLSKILCHRWELLAGDQAGNQWSYTLYRRDGANVLDPGAVAGRQLAAALAPLMGAGCRFRQCTESIEGQKGAALCTTFPSSPVFAGNPAQPIEQSGSVLLLQCIAAGGAKKTRYYLHGVWDSAIVDGRPANPVGWAGRQEIFFNELLRGWGWLTAADKVTSAIAAVTPIASGQVVIETNDDVFDPPWDGTQSCPVYLKGIDAIPKFKNPVVVIPFSASSCTTLRAYAEVKLQAGSLARNVLGFQPIQQVSIQRATTRKPAKARARQGGRRR